MFTVIEGSVAVSKSKGIYRQGKLYERNKRIYAQWGNGYITISKGGSGPNFSTSIPDVVIEEYHLPFEPKYTAVGFMYIPILPKRKKALPKSTLKFTSIRRNANADPHI